MWHEKFDGLKRHLQHLRSNNIQDSRHTYIVQETVWRHSISRQGRCPMVLVSFLFPSTDWIYTDQYNLEPFPETGFQKGTMDGTVLFLLVLPISVRNTGEVNMTSTIPLPQTSGGGGSFLIRKLSATFNVPFFLHFFLFGIDHYITNFLFSIKTTFGQCGKKILTFDQWLLYDSLNSSLFLLPSLRKKKNWRGR